VSDLVLVLEMADDLRTAGQPPHQPPPVRRRNLHRRLYGEPAHAVPRGWPPNFAGMFSKVKRGEPLTVFKTILRGQIIGIGNKKIG